MQLTKETAESKIIALGMDDMPLIQLRPVQTALPPDWFQRYKETAHKFMESLTDSIEELSFMNLSQDDFMALIMGRKIPDNFSIRFRTPLIWGGRIETDNMFMCRTFPHSHNIDRFLISQSGAETIWLPNPAKKIYIPAHTAGGGDGGNATEDRLSQLAAQMSVGRDI